MSRLTGFTETVRSKKESSFKTFVRRIFSTVPNASYLPLGEVLIQEGAITRSQLKLSLELQNNALDNYGIKPPLGGILVKSGIVSDSEVIDIINRHYGLSITTLSSDIEEKISRKKQTFLSRILNMRRPIWVQLSIAITLLILVAVAVLSAIILHRQKTDLYQQTLKLGTVSLTYFANNAGIPLIEGNILRLNTLIKEADTVEGIRYAVITDLDSRIKAHTDPRMINQIWKQTGPKTSDPSQDGVVHFQYQAGGTGEKIINLTTQISFKEKELGFAHVGVSADFIDHAIDASVNSIVQMTSIILLLGIITAIWLSVKFSGPILKLASASDELSNGNYSCRVDLATNDEIRDLSVAFNRMSKELWLKSLMQESFGKYVGAEVLQMIMANPVKAWVKGKRTRATIVFADIRGFTAYSTGREPEEIIHCLTQYFDISLSTLSQYGFIDKLIGDAVLAVFGVPVANEDHEYLAVSAALELQANLAAEATESNPLLKRVGISINSGIVVAGNIGSQVKMEYTVIGNTVNIASKLNRYAGPGEVVISQSVLQAVEDRILAKPVDNVMHKETPSPVPVFRVEGMKESARVTP